MMRIAFSLLLMTLVALCLPQAAAADDLVFSGAGVVALAQTLVQEAEKGNQLPNAFEVPLADGQNAATITVTHTFELFARALVLIRDEKAFPPKEVRLTVPDMRSPASSKLEPTLTGQKKAMVSTDLVRYAEDMLKVITALKRLPGDMKLGTSVMNRTEISTAQFIMAMASLIDRTRWFVEKMKVYDSFPDSVSVLLIKSPANWASIDNPVAVTVKALVLPPPENPNVVDNGIILPPPPENTVPQEIQPPPPPPFAAYIFLNGIELTNMQIDDLQRLPPFSGKTRVEVRGDGAIGQTRVLLDSVTLGSFSGPVPFEHTLDTVKLPDGDHRLTVIATSNDAEPRTATYTCTFVVRNYRESGHSPIEE